MREATRRVATGTAGVLLLVAVASFAVGVLGPVGLGQSIALVALASILVVIALFFVILRIVLRVDAFER